MIRVLSIDKTAGLESSHERHQSMAQQKGIELHVLGPRHWIESGREIVWKIREDQNYFSHFGSVFFKDYYARVGYYSGLCKALIQSQPDIIQLFEEPWSITALQTIFAASIFAPGAKLFFYTWENIYRPWEYPSRASLLYRSIDKSVHTLSTGAVCATEGAKEVLIKKGYQKPILVNPYGLPSFFFERKPVETDDSRPFTFGYIGRMMYMKGIDLLLEALAALPDTQLLLVGGGKDAVQYRENAQRMGVDNRIEWLAGITEQRVPDALQRIDVFVLPSRHTYGWKEQLGRVAIEAMSVGIPVIGSNSGAIPEVVGDAGLFFEENSPEDLIKQLIVLRDDPQKRTELGEKGIQRARKLYTWPRFAVRLCDFYRSFS